MKRCYLLTAGAHTLRLRLTMSGQRVLREQFGEEALPFLLSCLGDGERLCALLTQCLTWPGADNPITQGEALYDFLVDAGWRGQERKAEQQRKADSDARQTLLKLAQRMKRLKTSGATREQINSLIGNLDTVAVSMTGQTVSKLTDLQQWYDTQCNTNPNFLRDTRTENTLKRLSQKHISDMTLEDVIGLTNALRNMEAEIRNENKMIASAERRETGTIARAVIEDVQAAKGTRLEGNHLLQMVEDSTALRTLTPERMVRRLTGYVDGDPLVTLTQELSAGQRTMLDYQMRAEKLFSKWTNDSKFIDSITGKNSAIEITGYTKNGEVVTLKITPAMRMSLYLHSLCDQNMRHIARGGINIPSFQAYVSGDIAEAYARGTTLTMDKTTVQQIISQMTAEEKAFADAAHDYYAGMSSEEINKVSVELLGYEKATIENYFPIATDPNFNFSETDLLQFDATIEGQSFLKSRQSGASNPILLADMTRTLNTSIQQNGRYVGLAIPMRNFRNALSFGTVNFDAEGNKISYAGNIAQAIQERWGSRAMKYLDELRGDLSGNTKKTMLSDSPILEKVRSNYAGAVLTFNVGTAMKQAASYPTAASVLGYEALIRAMGDVGKVDLDLIAEYTPLQWYRSKGFSTQELGDLQTSRTLMSRVMSVKALNWIQGMDLLTTRKLWKASEYYVQRRQSELTRGSTEYYRAVAEIYNRVIEETQPNYTTMQRGSNLRSKNQLVQLANMFKTQLYQNFNIMYDATGNLIAKMKRNSEAQTEESRAALRSAMGDFARAISSQVVATAVIAAVNLAKSFLFFKTDKYEDEDGALTVESVLSAMGWDMLSSFMGTIPKGSELYDVLSAGVTGGTYYGIEYSSLSTVTDTISSLLDAWSLVTGILDGTQDTSANALLPKIDSIADDVSKLLGIPAENLLSVFYAAERWVFTALEGEYVGEYTLLSQQKAFSSSTSGTYYSLLFEAAERDTTQFAYIYADMIANNLTTEEKIADAMLTRAANAIVTAADTGEGFDEAVSTAEWLVNEGIVDREKLATKVINGLFNDASEDEVNLYDAFTNDIDLYNELVDAFIATGLIEQEDIGKALTSEAKDNLYSALEVSVSEYEALVLALVNEGADYSSIVSSMRSMYNDAVAEDADYSLNQTALDAISSTGSTVDSLTTGELEIYLDSKTGYLEEWKGKIEASSTYRSMSEEVQEAVVTAYTNLANQLALYEATGDEAVFTAKWYYTAAVSAPAQGIDPWKYVLIYRYKNSLSGDIKGQFTTWLASQGLTDAQQEWVLSQFYTTG